MKVYKRFLMAAFLVLLSGAAMTALAQEDPLFSDPQKFLEQLLGSKMPTTTEDILESIMKQQEELAVSGSYIELEPEFPGPREEVKVSFISHSFDVNTAYISWTHNGKAVLSGRGEKVYRFTTGDVGGPESITLQAVAISGKEFKVSKTLHIGDVDLLWSAATMMPPEYRGKAMVSPRSLVQVSAFPNFVLGRQRLSSASLVYEWNLDDNLKSSISGRGKSTFSFYASIADRTVHEVALKVYNLDNSIVMEKAISIEVRDPSVLIYEELSAGGPNMARAIKNSKMLAGETRSFRASPYYFAKSSGDKLKFKWTVQHQSVPEDDTPEVLSVTLTDDAAGTALVSTLVEGTNNIIERALTNFLINIL